MVRRSLIVAFVAVLVSAAAHAELDLNPQFSPYTLEGIKFPQLAFSDGPKRITYAPPRNWHYSGSKAKLSLQPPNTAQAEATITRVPLPAASPMSDELMKNLVAEVMASVPGESADVTLVSQEKNLVLIGGRETFLVTVTYTLYGEKYTRSCLFLNRPTDQIRFQFVSRTEEFKTLHKAFYDSLFSWQNL